MAGIRTIKEELEEDEPGFAQYNSDTDDWTLVSPPSSKSSSPERRANVSSNAQPLEPEILLPTSSQAQQTPTTDLLDEQTEAQQYHNEDNASITGDDADDESDGMTEINLRDDNGQVANPNIKIVLDAKKAIRFATPLCATDEVDESKAIAQFNSKPSNSINASKSSATSSSPPPSPSSAMVPATAVALSTAKTDQATSTVVQQANKSTATIPPIAPVEVFSPPESAHNANLSSVGWCLIIINSLCFVSLVAVIQYSEWLRAGPISRHEMLARILESSNRTFNFVYLDPSNHAYTELKLLDEEMLDCIRRENPNFEEIKQWLQDDSQRPTHDYNSAPNIKPFKGLVCYEEENAWRKKFNKLKVEHNLDLAKILRQVRRQLTYEMLELHHPSLRFKLIINQLEYLDFVDQRRKDRAIERLKAENFELSRRQSAPLTATSQEAAESHPSSNTNNNNRIYQQSANNSQQKRQQQQLTNNALVNLESENRRLLRENEMLRKSLGEKAGTIYIKQSIELEKCERENSALRHFHHQVAQEVSKGLKQLNLHITDFGTILTDRDESLSARLDQTRGYLMRLVEEITHLAAKNRKLQDELRETRVLNALVVREAQNLIEGESGLEVGEHELDTPSNAINNNNFSTINGDSSAAADLPEARRLRELDILNCSTNSDCLTTKVNWLLKRAKLRERLRKAPEVIDPVPCNTQTHNEPELDARRNAHYQGVADNELNYDDRRQHPTDQHHHQSQYRKKPKHQHYSQSLHHHHHHHQKAVANQHSIPVSHSRKRCKHQQQIRDEL